MRKSMSAFVGALLLLTAASRVSGCACRVTHNHTVQCFGALGESVFLHLANGTKDTEISVKKKYNGYESVILKYAKHKSTLYEYVNRSEYFSNGTFRLDRALKNDSGEYTVDIYNTLGTRVLIREMQIIIQAPVSRPVLSQLCLPHREVRVSCSSEGDVSDYRWTLGRKPLNRAMAYLSDKKNTVILKKNVSGELTCTARNDISHASTTVQMHTCPAPVTCTLPNGTVVTVTVNTTEDVQSLLINNEVLIAVSERETISVVCNSTLPDSQSCEGIMALYVVGTVFTFLALTAAMCCFKRNRTGITGNNETQELVYAEVTGVCAAKRGREMKSKPVTEVVYEQIQVPGLSDHTVQRAQDQKDPVKN